LTIKKLRGKPYCRLPYIGWPSDYEHSNLPPVLPPVYHPEEPWTDVHEEYKNAKVPPGLLRYIKGAAQETEAAEQTDDCESSNQETQLPSLKKAKGKGKKTLTERTPSVDSSQTKTTPTPSSQALEHRTIGIHQVTSM
jgi:hypothetical protein